MFVGLHLLGITIKSNGVNISFLPLLVFIIFGAVFILPFAVFRRWYFYRRRLKKNIITAEYEPPLGLNPAELGYMFDGKLRQQEVGGTIIHLLQRGVLHMRKVEGGKRIFAGPKVESNLKEYEKKLVEEAEVPDGISADELMGRFTSYKSKNINTPLVSREFMFTQYVHADLLKRQYVRGSFIRRFLQGSFNITILLLIIFVLLPIFGVWCLMSVQEGIASLSDLGILLVFASIFSLMFFPAFFIAGMILNYFKGRVIGRECMITPKLKRLWPQIVGFRQYVRLVENDRLEFQARRMAEVSKNDTLPYAVALGFVKNWRDIIN